MSFGIEMENKSLTKINLRFDKFPTVAHDRLVEAMWRIEKRLEAAVLADEPTMSGKLKSLTGGRVYDHGTRIAAVVGVRDKTQQGARKAAALNYGSRGRPVDVRAHEAWLDHYFAQAMSLPHFVLVRAHKRVPNIEGFKFLQKAIASERRTAIEELRLALEQAVTESNQSS